ncbi:MAG: HD domain-containing phosphohydrolase, partial [bacterium]
IMNSANSSVNSEKKSEDLKSHVVVIDDEEDICSMLGEFLRLLGYEVDTFTDSRQALESIRASDDEFDLVYTDIYMPGMSGIEVLEEIFALDRNIPVILMTGQPALEDAIAAVRFGAYDYLTKPFNLDLVELLTKRALERRNLVLENIAYRNYLEQRVEEQTREIKSFLIHSIESLSLALEARDPYTKGHGARVSNFVLTLARELSLPEEQDESLRIAGLLHDIGKIGVPDSILLKPGSLTEEEYELMKAHSQTGFKILAPIGSLSHVSTYVHEHHERMDGKGYPLGLQGNEIAFASRLLIVAEVCDALATERCYKPAWPAHQIIAYFKDHRGTAYDVDVTNALLSLLTRCGEEVLSVLRVEESA